MAENVYHQQTHTRRKIEESSLEGKKMTLDENTDLQQGIESTGNYNYLDKYIG